MNPIVDMRVRERLECGQTSTGWGMAWRIAYLFTSMGGGESHAYLKHKRDEDGGGISSSEKKVNEFIFTFFL